MKKLWKGMILTGILATGLMLSGCGGKAETYAKVESTTTATVKTAAADNQAVQPGNLALVYTYKAKAGAWANQIAAWVEDENGHIVRTLMATRFTAQGGYKKRSMSLPVWVKRSGLAGMDSSRVDSLTRATPRAGKQVLVWDGKNDDGQPVPDGTYKVILEATLYSNSDELFTGSFVKGGQNQNIKMDIQLNQEPEQKGNLDMISGVSAFYKGQ